MRATAHLVDAHCHLDQLADPLAALDAALEAGVGRVVAVSMDLPSMKRVLALRDSRPAQVVAALGVHPQEIPGMDDATLEESLAFVEAHLGEVAMLGEVGLDYRFAVDETQQARQGAALQRLLGSAARHRRPANLHCRRAERATLEMAVAFTRETGLGAQMHWFTHSKKLVRVANDAGVYVSAGPSIVFDEAQRAVAALVSRDLLLLETDSPVRYQERAATPAHLAEVARTVAGLWGCTVEEVAERVAANFARFLGP